MDKTSPIQSIQDSFLNTARRDHTVVILYLMSGVKLTGRIRGFDKYSLILESGNQEQMIFKHAISTISMIRHSNSRNSNTKSEFVNVNKSPEDINATTEESQKIPDKVAAIPFS